MLLPKNQLGEPPQLFRVKSCQASAIADRITSAGHNIKWDHFEILATGRSDIHCRIKAKRFAHAISVHY